MYLDRQRRSDGDHLSSLKEWEASILARYPGARFEVEDHGAFRRLFAHDGEDPTGADQIGNFSHNAGSDHGHGFVRNT